MRRIFVDRIISACFALNPGRNINAVELSWWLQRSRTLHTSALVRDAVTTFSPSTDVKAAEETEDVTALDRLLKVVRKRSDPAYHSIMPLRAPMLWSEAILASLKPQSTPDSINSSPTLPRMPEPRHMYDSYSELVLPFASNKQLLEQYTNVSGGLRTGKLMEHLDSLAGSIAYKHMLGPTVEKLGTIEQRGFYIVTASVDRLDMLAPLHPVRDLRLSGQVIYTGRSSMEVAVRMEALGSEDTEETILLGRFSMVCRDAYTHRAREVNSLILSTPDEQALFNMGEGLKRRRQSLALRSLSRVPPTSVEAQDLHTFYLNHGQDGHQIPQTGPSEERVWMRDTHLEKTMLMFPQERNVHQKIFGGYLMRLAYELGFSNAALFTRSPIRFLSLDGISFARPVPIGSILRLASHILHSSSSSHFPTLVHVGVQANVVDVNTGFEQTTNDFRFTWCREGSEPLQRRVVPKTYKEAMLWLEGKRALQMGAEIRELRRRPDGEI